MIHAIARVLAFLLLATAPAVHAADDPWAAARETGVHILMRHASAPGTGDPPGFRLGDCTTQRNLDEGGRAQARRIGEAIREAGVAVDLVLSSQWCRAAETARLLDVGAVEPMPALNSFFDDRPASPEATAALRARLAALAGRTAVLVTHQVNVTALTGVVPASGEIVFVSLDAAGDVAVRGRLLLR